MGCGASTSNTPVGAPPLGHRNEDVPVLFFGESDIDAFAMQHEKQEHDAIQRNRENAQRRQLEDAQRQSEAEELRKQQEADWTKFDQEQQRESQLLRENLSRKPANDEEVLTL